MEILVLNPQFEVQTVLDVFESLIWTDRYCGYGDFELYIPFSFDTFSKLAKGNYLIQKNSDRVMIIETSQIDNDTEDGAHLTVTGRSLESILERRIIWGQTVLTGNFQNAIKKLLTDSIIAPTNVSRKIDNFTFIESTDLRITSLTIDAQYFGDNLYDSILALCQEKGLGFRVLADDSGVFSFELFCGEDRSYSQDTNPWVVFSPEYDNLLSSKYIDTDTIAKTVALSAGEGEGSERKLVEVLSSSEIGLARREMYVDSSGISATTDSGTLTDAEYTSQLSQNGKNELAKVATKTSFEGEVDATRQYVYGSDFFLGDVVQIMNEYGIEAKSMVSEIVLSYSTDEASMIPTFVGV